MNIPFCKTTLGVEEKQAICDVIDSGWVVMGKKTQEFEEEFAKYVGAKYAVMVDSGTSALDLSVKRLLEEGVWKKGDEIKVPSLTFTSSAEVLVNNGLYPLFWDVREETFSMASLGREHDKLSLPVNLLGNRSNVLSPIVDSAHRILRGDLPGSDAMWCYSLYATKNMTTASGGVIVTNNEEQYKWLKLARDHGVTKGTTERYKDGQPFYDIEFIGWRYKPTDIDAVIGLEQLKKLDYFNLQREGIINQYNKYLLLNRSGLHLYPIYTNDRPKFIQFMREKGVQVSVHFRPLHQMTGYKKIMNDRDKNRNWDIALPCTTALSKKIVSLPLYPQLTDDEVKYICDKTIESGLFTRQLT